MVLRHKGGVHTKELVEIPWFVIDKGEKRYSETDSVDF